ncbi:hypothetical protein ACJA3J_16840 [Halobacillus sp. SY10]|uniref:Thoeris anti-defense 2-like domain-containing protein n=1 Tax=Halobacillus aidingensis TaxID=240303 RepID=A0A1H0HSI5_HALAD|nr:hypothetical protein [Halobacillus aidingensis]SDO22107.1 hypothetical protein SAMN05421677_103266 [Halobacillus aidingensis]
MNFMQAVQLLDEGHALERHTWKSSGYIVKDEKGKIVFFDHNEPTFYSLTTEDALASDWEQTDKDQWTIVSVSHDRELMQGKLFVSYHICAENGGSIMNNHLVEADELSQWSRFVNLDLTNSARYLNEQDVATVQNTISA